MKSKSWIINCNGISPCPLKETNSVYFIFGVSSFGSSHGLHIPEVVWTFPSLPVKSSHQVYRDDASERVGDGYSHVLQAQELEETRLRCQKVYSTSQRRGDSLTASDPDLFLGHVKYSLFLQQKVRNLHTGTKNNQKLFIKPSS